MANTLQNKSIYLVVWIMVSMGAISAFLLISSDARWQAQIRENVPLRGNISQARADIIKGQLLLERLITGDISVRSQDVWPYFKQSILEVEDCINGKSNIAYLGAVIPTDPILLNELEQLRKIMQDVFADAKILWEHRGETDLNDTTRQRSSFYKMEQQIQTVVFHIDKHTIETVKSQGRQFSILFGIFVCSFSLASISVFIISRKMVQAEEKLKKAYSLLEQKVEERTATLKTEKQRAQQYLDTASVMLVALNTSGRIILINPKGCEILKVTESEAIGKSWVDNYIPPRIAEETTDVLNKIVEGDLSLVENHENPILRSDGEERIISFHNATLRDPNMEISGVLFSGEDITEKKLVQDEIARGRAEFAAIFNSISDGVVFVDTQRRIVRINPAFNRMFGYQLAEIAGQTTQLIYADPESYLNQGRARFKPDAKITQPVFENEYRRKDGTTFPGETIGVHVVDETGQLLGYIGVIDDITERKKAETALKESNEELDAFVQTVAHDLRTPLTPIIGYAQMLQMDYREQLAEQGLSYLAVIEKAGEEMLNLMENLLSLAKSGEMKRPDNCVSTDEVVAGVIKNLEAEILSAGVILQATSLPSARVPKTFLIQIFDNLIGNAVRYAGSSGGLIEVGGEQTGKQIIFFVRDHGPGIPEQERKHIFEVFYRGTNKGEIKGSGVGLSIVYKIARNCGGRAWVEETPGGGCTFWVEIEDVAHS